MPFTHYQSIFRLPLVFDNPIISEMVMQDRHIKHIMEIGKEAHVAIFTVGSVNDDALLFRLGYFSEEEKKRLKENGRWGCLLPFYRSKRTNL